MDNQEINNLKKILGLQHNKKYCRETVKSLRYGHVLIMADQDHDGSHIKGLVINFFDHFWPSLLLVDGFMQEFITPIMKATKAVGRTKHERVFFTVAEYKEWQDSVEGRSNGWMTKYYKGLGTSTNQEAKEYFSNLERHQLSFSHQGEDDRAMIDLAFNKNRVTDRKEWLSSFAPGTFFNHEEDELNYSNFVNKELILFSLADNARSIPNIMDGLKPSQRKVLYGCFMRKNFKREIKVLQLAGFVTEKAVYHHGDSIFPTIVSMAQDFVGSNNVNLLVPAGQFGTRLQGGKDAASPRYIFTKLAPIARALFPKSDDPLLSYLKDEGMRIEPLWYCPIIPLVLVNGSEGIGTGWSSSIPCYNPHDLIRSIRQLLNDEPLEELLPWYRGFNGSIVPVGNSKSFDVYGVLRRSQETFRIEELPVRTWTSSYKEFLESQTLGFPNAKDPFVREFQDNSTENKVCFTFTATPQALGELSTPAAYKKLKISSSLSTNNMVLFDKDGRIRKYDSPQEIIKEFFGTRYELYEKRRLYILEELQKELLRLDNKQRFILMVVDGKLKVSKRKKVEIISDLKRLKFDPIPRGGKRKESEGDELDEDNDGGDVEGSSLHTEDEKNYDYLLSMPLWSLTFEKVQQLRSQRDKKEAEIHEMEAKTVKHLWEADLQELEEALRKDEERAKLMMEDLERVARRARLKQKGASAKGKRGKAATKYFDDDGFMDDLEDVPLPGVRVLEQRKPRAKKQAGQLSTSRAKISRVKRKQTNVEEILDDEDLSDAEVLEDEYSEYSDNDISQRLAVVSLAEEKDNLKTKRKRAGKKTVTFIGDEEEVEFDPFPASEPMGTTGLRSRRNVKKVSIVESEDDDDFVPLDNDRDAFEEANPLNPPEIKPGRASAVSVKNGEIEISDDDSLSLSQRLAKRSSVQETINTTSQKHGRSGSRGAKKVENKTTTVKRPRAPKSDGIQSVSLISPSPSPVPKKTKTSKSARGRKETSEFDDDDDFSPEKEVEEIKPISRPRRQRAARKIVIEESDSDLDF
eukprot:TRINITY_DN448_c0_g1_i1.p2 TRINITY_DN448_c0_g1~~TRINITY_DN448_c0_g1_i1.p2  ORF type:complete len:1029 (-),score=202.61 TRINITY_DN448_c0_g1_i1:8870-11956(-)